MKRLKYFALFLVVLVVTLMVVEPALAGPGGKIARAMFETFWGKLLLAVLVIILSPLILYTVIKEKLAERRARKRSLWDVVSQVVYYCRGLCRT